MEGERPDDIDLPTMGFVLTPSCQAEDADDWSYQRGLEGGWIPQDPTDRMYPNICSSSS